MPASSPCLPESPTDRHHSSLRMIASRNLFLGDRVAGQHSAGPAALQHRLEVPAALRRMYMTGLFLQMIGARNARVTHSWSARAR